ncbi:uncharacterized protein [Littorina saxatilis]|uniref:3-oxo-5-alpha-steroid 4-dehydrogenase C-terminal domain-containing protein n=1 Tax=Littorina saxatilis TaxID=31220 RepID=A0AAN9GB07_9CAEN
MALFDGIPYRLYAGSETRFIVHLALCGLGFLLAVITFVVQVISPAPYGKHENKEAKWGPPIPQRLGHMLSDALPGVVLFVLVFFFYGYQRGYANYTFLALFLAHYVQRGIVHPLMMRYRNAVVPLGITLGGFGPNCLYHFINADFIGSADYDDNFYYDPRFILGILLFVAGYIINRWADWKLRSLRNIKGDSSHFPEEEQGSTGYYIPYGGMFELVTCPNYFGELVEWLGWTIATWSLAGLVWTLFSAATFIPRSRHNHAWYKQQFEMYPPNRKALIPCLL